MATVVVPSKWSVVERENTRYHHEPQTLLMMPERNQWGGPIMRTWDLRPSGNKVLFERRVAPGTVFMALGIYIQSPSMEEHLGLYLDMKNRRNVWIQVVEAVNLHLLESVPEASK